MKSTLNLSLVSHWARTPLNRSFCFFTKSAVSAESGSSSQS